MISAPGRASTPRLPTVLALPHEPASVSLARQELARSLRREGIADHTYEAAILIASELLSNAVKHARPRVDGKVGMFWEVRADVIEVAVVDGGSATRPRSSHRDGSATSGRGLAIVGELATDWGVTEEPGGSTVWARIERIYAPRPGAAASLTLPTRAVDLSRD